MLGHLVVLELIFRSLLNGFAAAGISERTTAKVEIGTHESVPPKRLGRASSWTSQSF